MTIDPNVRVDRDDDGLHVRLRLEHPTTHVVLASVRFSRDLARQVALALAAKVESL